MSEISEVKRNDLRPVSYHAMIEIPKKLHKQILSIIPSQQDAIFSTNMYKEKSVESMERAIRGIGKKLLLQGENTKRPADWKLLLSTEDNYRQLTQMLRKL